VTADRWHGSLKTPATRPLSFASPAISTRSGSAIATQSKRKATVGLETIMTNAVFSKFIPFTAALIVNGSIIAGMSYLFDLEMNYGTGVCCEDKSCSSVCHDIYRYGDAVRALSAPSIVKDINAMKMHSTLLLFR
jgi:hypothetical protein